MKPSTNALLLLLQIAAITSSSLAAGESLPAGVTCADSSSLQLNECLTAGKAICSPSEAWAFGIDPADRRIKLWHGDQVRFVVACLFCCVHNAGEQKKPSTCIIHTDPTENLVTCIYTKEENKMKDTCTIVGISHH